MILLINFPLKYTHTHFLDLPHPDTLTSCAEDVNRCTTTASQIRAFALSDCCISYRISSVCLSLTTPKGLFTPV